MSLGSYLDALIFDQYSDEEEDVKIYEDLLFSQISSSSSFQQRDDKKCVHVVIDACYESIAQRSNKDLFSFDISCKDIIVEEEIDSSLCHPLKLHCCMLWFHLFFRSRLRISSAD